MQAGFHCRVTAPQKPTAAGRTWALTFHRVSPGPQDGLHSSTAWIHPSTPPPCAWCFWRRQQKANEVKEASEGTPILSKMHQLFQLPLLPSSFVFTQATFEPVQPSISNSSSSPLVQTPDTRCHSLGREFSILSSAGCFASTTLRSVASLKCHLPGRPGFYLVDGMETWRAAQYLPKTKIKYFICFTSVGAVLLCTPGFHWDKSLHRFMNLRRFSVDFR